MNEDKFNGLPGSAKICINKFSGHAFGDWASNLIDNQNAIMKNEISKKEGHEIIIASDSVIAEYKKILAPIESNWLEEMKGKGLDGDAVLKRARQIITAVDG
jgi:hypothetical protein